MSILYELAEIHREGARAILATPQLAASLNHAQVEPEHLLVTLAEQADGVVPAVLRQLNVDPAELARGLRERLNTLPKAYGGAEPPPSPRLRVVIDAAQADAKQMQDE